MKTTAEPSPNAVLEKLIIDSLAQGAKDFTFLYLGAVRAECERLEAVQPTPQHSWQRKQAHRFLDQRLQALRKAGKIVHNRKTGWALVKAQAT